MEEMNQLVNVQMNILEKITKARVNYKKSPKERITEIYVESRLELLNSHWNEFADVNRQIVQLSHNNDEKYFRDNVYDTTEDLFIEHKCELREALVKLVQIRNPNQAPGFASVPSSKCNSNFKLPKIQIPSFSGKYSEWTTFHDLFLSLVHNNDSIDDVQKLHYLKSHLSGEAEMLLRHVPVTAANYKQCWSLLQDRYNNKRLLSNNFLKRLLSLKNIFTESANALKEILDTTVDCLNGLRNLGVAVETWDLIIIYIVCHKLDNESRKQWELQVSASANDLPTFAELKSFLECRYRALEFVDDQPRSKYIPCVHHSVAQQSTNTATANAAFVCPFCQENHKLGFCKDFAKKDFEARHSFVQSNGLCFNCLGCTHSVKFCRLTTNCRICKKRHHSLLHPKGGSYNKDAVDRPIVSAASTSQEDISTVQLTVQEQVSSPTINSHFATGSVQHVLLATALIEAESKNGENQLLRALIDQGSQASFITEAAVQLLGLKKTTTKSVISGVGSEKTLISKSMVKVEIHSRFDPGCVFQVNAYVLKTLTSFLPSANLEPIQTWPEIKMSNLADPGYFTPSKIDILLGAEVFSKIILEGLVKYSSGSLVAQNTALGWVLSGQASSKSTKNVKVFSAHAQVEELLKAFWELEDGGTSKGKILSEEEQRCEEKFSASTTRDTNGRYIVKLPFRTDNPACSKGNSRNIALKRFELLERKLSKDLNLKQEFKKTFDEYIQLNHMQEVPEDSEKSKDQAVYLPYHAVVRNDKTTTKVRVVFDASCKGTNGISLNDDLMVGPTLQPELRHTIMRWRKHPICFTADVVKMYRQIKVDENDTNYQRILWRENSDQNIKDYKMLRLTFGTSSAPYLAIKSLMQLAIDDGKEFPLAAHRVLQDFYVDDLMSGAQTEAEAIEIYGQMNRLLEKGGFQLQKWSSNSKAILEKIHSEKLENVEEKKLKEKQESSRNKILGLTWNRDTDEFEYAVKLPQMTEPATKRNVISDISKLYDPLGWIAPSIIPAKILIQKIWLAGIKWDDLLPLNLLEEWSTYRNELFRLTDFRLPRWMSTDKNNSLVELHGFCDASSVAFGAVVYIRVVDVNGRVNVRLVTAKTRVAPIKQVSIPRLELCGAVLLAKLLVEVSEVLNISKDHLHAWTDSEVVLAWLSSHPSRWKTFIGNRVSEIISVLGRSQWSHVMSEYNPADCASRGIKPSDIAHHQLWLNGPHWLKEQDIVYQNLDTGSIKLEERIIKTHMTVNEEDNIWLKFSSLKRLLRVVAFCRRFIKKDSVRNLYLLNSEIDEALTILIKQNQNIDFKDELEALRKKELLNKRSKLVSLNPYIDSSGILRVGGRIENAAVPEERKHPIILSNESYLTKLLISDAHIQTMHGNPQLMLNFIRSKYWILGCKTAVKRHVKNCVICFRYKSPPKSYNPLMGQLPEARVTPQRAFSRSGVDFAGPIDLRISKGRGNRSYKGYICLFICMATRAIHLEVVSDLSTQGFLAAFKRFVARRGHCMELFSDNGTNFVGSARELKRLFSNEQDSILPEIVSWLATNGTNWNFIPPHSPNFGGLWEAGVKSTKYHLKRVIGYSTLTFEELSTVLSQIEACLNSRPMTVIEDNGEQISISPGHFLIGEPLIVVPDKSYENSNVNSLRRWQYCQRMLNEFWRKWSQDYLTQFMHRYKWAKVTPEPQIGDIVLVKEDNLPPARWLLGRITEKHTGSDNVTRVVTLRYKNSLIKRPVSKLCKLPLDD